MKCPSCDVENPVGAPRCACGYVFKFDTPTGLVYPPRSEGSPLPVVAGAVATAAIVALVVTPQLGAAPDRPELSVFLIAAGAFAAAGGILDWDWFMMNRRARLFVALLGRTGARWFYALLGGTLAGLGLGFLA
jgi:hypothetical protein